MDWRRAMPLDDIGRTLLLVGLLIAVMGVLMLLGGQLPWLGRLPGDISIERGNFRFDAPVATFLGLSLSLTRVLNLVALRYPGSGALSCVVRRGGRRWADAPARYV